MIIDFDKMETKDNKNFLGGEKSMLANIFNDGVNKVLRGRLEPGASIGLHTHKTSSEIIYIIKGQGKVLIDGQYEKVSAGVCHYCEKGHSHSLINDSDDELIFLGVVPEQ